MGNQPDRIVSNKARHTLPLFMGSELRCCFWTPVNTAHVNTCNTLVTSTAHEHGCPKWRPCWRVAWTQVVCTELKVFSKQCRLLHGGHRIGKEKLNNHGVWRLTERQCKPLPMCHLWCLSTYVSKDDGWLVGWGLTALLTQNRSYRACRFVGIFYSKL